MGGASNENRTKIVQINIAGDFLFANAKRIRQSKEPSFRKSYGTLLLLHRAKKTQAWTRWHGKRCMAMTTLIGMISRQIIPLPKSRAYTGIKGVATRNSGHGMKIDYVNAGSTLGGMYI